MLRNQNNILVWVTDGIIVDKSIEMNFETFSSVTYTALHIQNSEIIIYENYFVFIVFSITINGLIVLRKTFSENIRKLQSNIIEITIRHGYSPVILLHIFRITFYKNIFTWLLLTDHLLKETCHLSTLYTGTC